MKFCIEINRIFVKETVELEDLIFERLLGVNLAEQSVMCCEIRGSHHGY
jgi:hypothetical protein